MTIKKSYKIGDTVWIYGISRTNNRITQGKIVYSFNLTQDGYSPDIDHYVVSVANELEPLLEIRTWETISQDSTGPVGAIREAVSEVNTDAVDKKLSQIGLTLELSDEPLDAGDDLLEPTPDQIYAAIERSKKQLAHEPLNLDPPAKPKRRFYSRKKSK